MAEGREKSEWARASALLALIANAHRDAKKTRAFTPGDFDPFARSGSETVNDPAALEALLTGQADGQADKKTNEGTKETNDA